MESVPYENDQYRFEQPEQMKRLAFNIRQAYNIFNYPIIDVPLLPIDQRAKLIINQI